MSVYSTRFYGGSITARTEVYTVPAAMVVVVRDIEVRDASSSGSHRFTMGLRVGSTDVNVITVGALGPESWWQWKGRLVLVAGEKIVLTTDGGSLRVAVSGYLLDA